PRGRRRLSRPRDHRCERSGDVPQGAGGGERSRHGPDDARREGGNRSGGRDARGLPESGTGPQAEPPARGGAGRLGEGPRTLPGGARGRGHRARAARPVSMPLQLKLAIRNVFRNRRRTLITLAAMAFGVAAIVVFGGFVHSIYWGVRESTIRSQIGHIQLYRAGFSEKGNVAPYDYLIDDYPALRAELVKL